MYDFEGIVEDYITYLLDDINENFQSLIIVVCGHIKNDEIQKLKKYTDRIFFRDNYGYDAYAFKDAILKYLNEGELAEYDELVLFNDTFYGPFYPFKKVFEKMEGNACDYWGLTKHGICKMYAEHVQSYFLTIKARMLHSLDFIEFWKTLDLGRLCMESLVHNYEVHFTEFFTSRNYTYDTLVKDEEMNNEEENINHYLYFPYTLIKKYHMPVIKRKIFVEPKNLFLTAGEELNLVFRYIDKNTNYNVDMIWQDLLRKYDMCAIKNNLNLNYVLSYEEALQRNIDIPRTIVIAHITYDELVDECISYLKNVPEGIDICVTSYKDSVLNKVSEMVKNDNSNISTRKLINRGRDVAAIFVGCKELVKSYEYVCFVHDKKTTGKRGPYSIGASFNSLVWENTLKSDIYIKRIIDLFNNEKRLGLLCPPKPLHGDYRTVNVAEWSCEENYLGCLELAKKLNYKHKPELSMPPFCLSTCFWCKREALESLWNAGITVEDFPEEPVPMDGVLNHILERMLVLAAQNAGYYSAIVETDQYASLDLQNRELWLRGSRGVGDCRNLKLARFVGESEALYIYGAGIEASKVKCALDAMGVEILGYIVSDQYYDTCNSKLSPLIRLSSVPQDDSVKIVVGLNYGNSDEVRPILYERGYKNILFYNEKTKDKKIKEA